MKHVLLALLLFIFTLPVLAENTILIVGDSLSAGLGIDPNRGWVTLLEQKLKQHNYFYRVINSSVSGSTTGSGLERLAALLNQYHPEITIIELGGNDGLRGLQLFVIKNNLQKMITLAKVAASNVVLLGVRLPPNYGETYNKKFEEMYINLGEENNILVVPYFLKNVDDQPGMMQNDRIHPSESAQYQLLENVWGTLQKLLK